MSEKKSKKKRGTVTLPKYNVSHQLEYVRSFCEHTHFDSEVLTGLILADFICTVETMMIKHKLDLPAVVLAYADHALQVEKNFRALQEEYNSSVDFLSDEDLSSPQSSDDEV